ncbi:MAG: hypothetical protein IJU91_07005, partial [Selenomonadaceae bacterium]|nr:hypothetical protein [Selenomonadaceae bacterium]
MAGRESISDLYLRLGLQYDELQSNFVDAQSTIQTNMARLARENTTIRLQAQVDISGLDEATDAAQIFNIRTQALNRQIENQRDRVNMANAQLRNMATAHGANSDQAQRARIAYERERLALANLERELRNLNDTQNESNSNSGDFIENLQGMAEKAAPVVAGITAIAGALQMASDYSVELIEKFRELQNQAYELNMPFGKSKEFLRQLRLGGGDYGDFQGYIRGITDAYVKGEVDDPEFIALSRYGAQITDASGKLKDFKDITEEVYQAYKKAKAEGNEIEFLQLTGGESGITDAIQFFQRYEEAKEDAAKIFDSGINPDELHKSERALNLLTEQMDEFKDATTDVITPATQAAMEGLFEAFHSGTQFIAENKEEIRRWGFIAEEVFSSFGDSGILSNLETSLSRITDKLKELSDTKLDFGDAGQNAQYEKFLQGIDEQNKKTFHNDFLDFAYGGIIERATANQQAYNAAIKETGASYADIIKKAAQVMSQGEQLSQYGIQRANQFKDELEDLRIELDFGDDEYGKAKAQNDLWLERELNDKLYVSKEEETAIRELYAARDEQIEQEKEEAILKAREESQKKIQDLMRESADIEFELTHDAFEKQLYDIEQWKQAQLEKAETAEEVAATIKNAAMKEADAFEKEMDRIKGRIESAQDKLARLTLSPYENDVRNAKKEYQEYIESGVPKELADAIYKAEMSAARKRASQDKSGSYTKNPNAQNLDDSPFIELNKNIEGTNKNFVDMDATQIAYQETLLRASSAIEELERNTAGGYSNAINQLNDSADALKQNFSDSLDSIKSPTDNLNNTLTELSNNAENLSGKLGINAESLNNATSATATFNRALENILQIESSRPNEVANLPSESPTGKQIEIIYGDEIVQSLQNEFTQASNSINTSTNDIISSFGQLPPAIDNASKAINEQADAAREKSKLDEFVPNTFDDALTNLTNSSNNVATELSKTAESILAINEKLSGFNPAQQADSSIIDNDKAKTALDVTGTIGDAL